MAGAKSPFLRSVHYFRAFAIVNVALVHVWRLPETADARSVQAVDALRELAFHGSTVYFLFIAGFLFSYLSGGFEARRYFLGKFRHVVAPYLVITAAIAVKEWVPHLLSGSFDPLGFLAGLLSKTVTGSAQYPYWYIPFVVPLLAASPLLPRIPRKAHLPIAAVAAVLPLLGTRTEIQITFGQYLYFVPVYLLGFFAGAHREAVSRWTRRFLPLLLSLAAASLVALAILGPATGARGFDDSLQYVSKICLTLVTLEWLRRFDDRELRVPGLLAEFSFSIYLTHFLFDGFLLRAFYSPILGALPGLSAPAFLVPLSMLYAALRVAFSLALCLLVKRLLGKRSRYLIGV